MDPLLLCGNRSISKLSMDDRSFDEKEIVGPSLYGPQYGISRVTRDNEGRQPGAQARKRTVVAGENSLSIGQVDLSPPTKHHTRVRSPDTLPISDQSMIMTNRCSFMNSPPPFHAENSSGQKTIPIPPLFHPLKTRYPPPILESPLFRRSNLSNQYYVPGVWPRIFSAPHNQVEFITQARLDSI
ncbi:hypothetical protein BDV25DRAFT_153180 [Aspergillus avenaceus]|uniref:Uncharacterized protein n=1 Tax=Aspergillus avenaceus TaxID=36643 RepID=A0A5N6TXI2_ASPAV|nr:hypothetical protein BDV25DRAFT_153180 [Aspergillus avenaceus]